MYVCTHICLENGFQTFHFLFLEWHPKPNLNMFCAPFQNYQHFFLKNVIFLKQIAWGTQKWHQTFSMCSGSDWLIDQNMHNVVFINNSRTVWPITIKWPPPPGNVLQDVYIVFPKNIDNFERVHKIMWKMGKGEGTNKLWTTFLSLVTLSITALYCCNLSGFLLLSPNTTVLI